MTRRDAVYSSTPLHFQNSMKFLFRSTVLLLLLGLFGYAAAPKDGPSRPWAAFTKEISVATGISGFGTSQPLPRTSTIRPLPLATKR